MATTLRYWLCIVVLLAGCTAGSSNGASESTAAESSTAASPEEETAPSVSTTTASPTSSDDAPSSDEATSIDPLKSAGDPPPTTADSQSTSAWISRVSMSAERIEVRWSDRDGADKYFIHRLVRSSDDRPGVEAMTDDSRIHVANDLGSFIDEEVEPDTRYWYGVRIVDADDNLIAHGWHRADAVDDEEPPSPVPALTAVEADEDEVLVSWSKPDENYQLHGYRVFRGVDGETPESIATTWRLEQTSFLDDELPASGKVVYEVVAFDFHWNDSLPARVTIDLP